MIVVVEPVRQGIEHEAFNTSLLRVLRAAFPAERVLFYAERRHLAAVEATLRDDAQIQFEALSVAERHAKNLARLGPDFWAARLALRVARREAARLLVFSSVTAPLLWHIRMLAAFYSMPRTIGVLHGGLAGALRRPRFNIPARWVSLRSALSNAPSKMKFAVLEKPILQTVERAAPALARRLILLPHPLPPDLGDRDFAPPAAPPPLKIGLLGLCTRQKGLFTFLEAAAALSEELDGAIEFHIVGRLHRDHVEDAQRYAKYLARPAASSPLPRNEFVKAIAELHYAAFFFDGKHYDGTASGVLLDCVALGLPLIGRRHPLLEELFAGGDVGELCNAGDEVNVLRRLATDFDPETHRLQRLNMLNVRKARSPAVLADKVRSEWSAL